MIKIIQTISELDKIKRNIKNDYALVPTMGNLHQGHLNLVERALEDFDIVIVSIFVNPLQFGPNEDFNRYPRTLNEDINALNGLIKDSDTKQIIVFAPASPEVMYPDGHQTTIRNTVMDEILCGKSRPGHFEGVCTIVYRLFKLIEPKSAYFGLKDYQQLKLIQRMNKDLMLGINIIECPTARDENGLALSSRNRLLSVEEKQEATLLNKALLEISQILKGRDWKSSKDIVQRRIAEIKGIKNNILKWDYLEVRENKTLSLPKDEDQNFTIFGAAFLGKTRLIDNIEVKEG